MLGSKLQASMKRGVLADSGNSIEESELLNYAGWRVSSGLRGHTLCSLCLGG